jgi:cytochrome P450
MSILTPLEDLFERLMGTPSMPDALLKIARNLFPVARLGTNAAVTRYDDVVAVLTRGNDFAQDYNAKLDVIMGGQPFFLGLPDGPAYQQAVGAMRQAMPPSDIASRLVPATLAAAQKRADAGKGSLNFVQYINDITFEVLCNYFGTPAPPGVDMKAWAQTLFTFLFADMNNDPAVGAKAQEVATAIQTHVDALIAARKAKPGGDDVLGRVLKLQAQGVPGTSDLEIRSSLIGFIVAGLPQPGIAAPQALVQLFERPKALAAATAAAKSGNDAALRGNFFEALRFDPLAPFLVRRAVGDQKVAGSKTGIPDGTRVFAVIQSAMMDGRHVKDPDTFNANRPASDNLSFGAGLHTCFAKAINEATIPLMLKPLLAGGKLRAAPGAAGEMVKVGIFPSTMGVNY